MDLKDYSEYTSARSKRSASFANSLRAFFGGGCVCGLGQLFLELFELLGAKEEVALSLVSFLLIFVAGALTAVGVFDVLAKYFGAGLLVPITGFSNSITAAAIDNKSEGFILGIGAKIFIIAGPVIVYGTTASVVYGIIYWVITFGLN